MEQIYLSNKQDWARIIPFPEMKANLPARRRRAACAPYRWHDASGAARRRRAACAHSVPFGEYRWHDASGAARMVECREVYKYYHTPAGDFPALQGINLNINKGEFIAVVGKSGAGKTTLVNVISGIDQPSSGEISINQTPIYKLSESQKSRWRCKNLGMVFQFFQLIPSLNLLENLTIAMDFCNCCSPTEQKERAFSLLRQVGLAEHAYKTPAKISGGQQQRVAIARALANDPPVLIADEPTGNLDWRTAGEIYDLFASLVEQGKTLLVVSHDKEITSRASRSVEIADGVIVS
jgi:putative ABC transport system ATP-binding protein